MKTKEEIEELAYERYGRDINSFGGQRDGFREGYIMCQESLSLRWIPVSENPPEIGKVYFLLQRNKNSFEGFRLEHHTGRMLFGQMLGNRFVETQDVTHYCERPELPKLPETPKPE